MSDSRKDRMKWAAKNGKGGRYIPHKGHGLDDDEDDFNPRKELERVEELRRMEGGFNGEESK